MGRYSYPVWCYVFMGCWRLLAEGPQEKKGRCPKCEKFDKSLSFYLIMRVSSGGLSRADLGQVHKVSRMAFLLSES